MGKFKTVGQAVDYCQHHGLSKKPTDGDLFETAETLFQAFNSGIHVGMASINDGQVFVDPKGDSSLMNRMRRKAKEMGCEDALRIWTFGG